jgi:hypothetical protein
MLLVPVLPLILDLAVETRVEYFATDVVRAQIVGRYQGAQGLRPVPTNHCNLVRWSQTDKNELGY